MSQMSFAEINFGTHRKVTRRAKFLEEMERALPWSDLLDLIAPHYPESGKVGRPLSEEDRERNRTHIADSQPGGTRLWSDQEHLWLSQSEIPGALEEQNAI